MVGSGKIDVARWKRGKLLANLGNALEALCGPAARTSSLAERAKAEGRACFAAAGLAITTESEESERLSAIVSGEIAGVVRGDGSTWQSLARGSRSVETDYLNGEVVMLGRMHGVPTPVNELLQRAMARAALDGVVPGAMLIDALAACSR